MRIGRRRFLRHLLATTAAVSWPIGRGRPLAAHEEPAEDPPIVDTHVHLWDLDRFHLAWLKPGEPLARNFLVDDYLKAAEGLGVTETVYMEVDVEPSQHVAEAEFILDLCRRHVGRLAGAVIGGRPASDGFRAYLDRFRDATPIKGLRQVLHGAGTPPGYCGDPAFVRGIRLLGERGLSFDLCMRAGELRDATTLVEACPGTNFILDHCGNPDVQAHEQTAWRADISRLTERPNVACKVSGIVASARPDAWTAEDLAPIVRHVLTAFGPDRVVFGGDWPVCTRTATLRRWVEALRQIVGDRSASENRRLFHDNALRIYRLG
jgi:L-fuconolactonase